MLRNPPVTRHGRATYPTGWSPFTRCLSVFVAVFVLLVAMYSSAHAEESPLPVVPNALIMLQSGVTTADAERAVVASDGHVLMVAEPALLLASLPPGADAALFGSIAVDVARIPVDAQRLQADYGLAAGGAASYWNTLFALDRAQSAAAGPFEPGGDPLVNDALNGPPRPDSQASVTAADLEPGFAPPPTYGPGMYDTSVVMQGRVAVSIFIPESSGNAENWSNPDPSLPGEDRVTCVIAEVMAGVQSWVVPGAPSGLSFSFAVYGPITVPVEPIMGEGVAESEQAWISPSSMRWVNLIRNLRRTTGSSRSITRRGLGKRATGPFLSSWLTA